MKTRFPRYLFGFDLARQGNDDLQTIINLAATAELFATTHYLAAINGDLGLAEKLVDYLKTGFLAEQDHLDLLRSLGAEPVVTEFYVPETLFSDVNLFAMITEVAETTFVSAYLAATRIFVEMSEPAFAVTAAQIAGVEAEHRALVRQIAGLSPNNIPYAQFQFSNVSDAVPVLQPFLDGSGEGFVGPVQPPTESDIMGIRASMEMLGYDNSIMPYAAIASMAATNETAMGSCVVANGSGQTVNVRTGPGTDFGVASVLSAGDSVTVDGQTTGSDGRTWYRVADNGGFVRSDVVSGGNCGGLPTV
jgi:hypothetical protein